MRQNRALRLRMCCAAAVMCLGATTSAVAATGGAIDRGRYLATLGDCEACHTEPGRPDRAYAGGHALDAWFGTVYSANITPDKTTGIGNWTADQFYRALTAGIGADGEHLYPAFPYAYFTRLTRADSDALYAFLRTVKPMKNTPPGNRLIFPADIPMYKPFRFGMIFWNWLFVPQSPFHTDPAKSADWNRGGIIVHGLGHCAGCHTPKTLIISNEGSKFLQGGVIDSWYAPNLTGSASSGLGRWSVADIETFLGTGENRFGRVVGAMQDVVRVSTSKMTESDRKAIAVYLKSIPAASEAAPPKPSSAAMRDGQAGFVQNCSQCHIADTRDYPSLVHNSVVQFSNATTMLRIVFQGSQSVATPTHPAGFSMPAFSFLSNAEIADIATYVRNSWGNRAGAVSARQAAQLRTLLGPDG